MLPSTLIIRYCTVNMVIISTMWEHWTGMISRKCVDMAWYEFVCKLIQHSRAFRGSYITSPGHITLHWNRLFALVACTALDCSADIYIIYVWTLWPLSEGRVAEPEQNINFEHTLSIPNRYVRHVKYTIFCRKSNICRSRSVPGSLRADHTISHIVTLLTHTLCYNMQPQLLEPIPVPTPLFCFFLLNRISQCALCNPNV